MYPFASLPENLAAFCGLLRRTHRFRAGPGELQDAVRALEVVELSDVRSVRDALRPILTSARDEVAVFDRAFAQFFFPGPAGVGESHEQPWTGAEVSSDAGRGEHRKARGAAAEEDESDAIERAGGAADPLQTTDGDLDETAPFARASYSPLEARNAGDAPDLEQVETEWRDAARSLVRRVHIGLSRRWRPASRGRRFDLRRTLRTSLQTGGEALAPRWLRRPMTRPRFVLLVDGSRSMSAHAQAALRMAVAMGSVTRRVEVFTFSTALQRVTPDVRRAVAGERRRLDRLEYAWGGGTSIGVCLEQFVRRFGERLLSRDTVVIIASDGLDVGDIDTLGGVMRTLHRRAASVVWLNPLLATPAYEPTASGMRVARPYVSTFANVGSAADLARLARAVRVRV